MRFDDRRLDGFIRKFADCLPDRLDSEGDYGVEYYSDIGGLVRVIMIAADLTVDGEYYGYGGGSHRKWLQQAVLGARADGIPWVVVGMHKVCVTTSTKSCEVGESVMDWLLAPGRADLILQGHEHGVQRSHQLRCVNVDKSTPGCIVDTDGNHSQGRGGVILIGGSFGRDSYRQNPDDSEAGYFAAQMPGDESPDDEQQGVWQLDFSSSSLKAQWVGSTRAYTDAFVMAASSLAPPAENAEPSTGGQGAAASAPVLGLDEAPKVGVTLVSRRVTPSGKARFRVRCPANEHGSPCKGMIRLKTNERFASRRPQADSRTKRRLTLGAQRFTIQAGRTRSLAVKVLRRHRPRLATGFLRVRAIAITRDAAGNERRVRRVISLWQPSRSG